MKEEMIALIAKLNYHTKLYNEGHPAISDIEWDKDYFKLKALEEKTGIIYPNSPTQSIQYTTVDVLNKVKHNHEMLSLNKTKDWNEFLNYFTEYDVIGMLKMDGLTCSLQYINGELISAETRGDGEYGEDIIHNIKVCKNVPLTIPYKDNLIVDGEIICNKKIFEKKFANEYKNARNFASGAIRLLSAKESSEKCLDFIAWNIIKGFNEEKYFSNKLERLKEIGFDTVPYTSSFDLDAKDFLINTAEEFGYPIDGLVGRFDDIDYGKKLGKTEHHFNDAYAFKFADEEYDTTLKNIEWSMGRTGVLTPVAVFESVEIDGTTVERASLHNYSIMLETMGTCCWLGQPIKVAKMNMIIPQITWAMKKDYGEIIAAGGVTVDGFSGELKCPCCGSGTFLEDSGNGTVNLVCENDDCEGKLINKLDHFCDKKGLDIKGLSKKTLGKLLDWGWISNIEDIYNLKEKKNEWIKKDGFGEASVSNILEAIEKSKNPKLAPFLCSIGIPLIGRTASKDLANKFNTWDNFIDAVHNNYKFYELNGFGPEMHLAIMNFNYATAIHLASFMDIEPSIQEESSNNLKGLTFVITGKLKNYKKRDDLKAEIEARGGKVTGSVSAKTTALINNDINSTTGKNKDAKAKGIPILTEEDFLKNYLNN